MHFLTLLSCLGKRLLRRRAKAVSLSKGLKIFEKTRKMSLITSFLTTFAT